MAHVETIVTGTKVITHVRGRVYASEAGVPKHDQTLKARTKPQAHRRRRICLLDADQAEWLEQYGVEQPCFGSGCRHHHFTRSRVEMLVRDGALRWVGGSSNVAAWNEARYLAIRPSGGVTTVQLVKGR